jgi:hypothetical protein
MVQEAQFTPAIKAQTLGEGLRAHLLEKLNRYETHLDRKFERHFGHAFEAEIASRRVKCNIAKSGAKPVRLWLSASFSENILQTCLMISANLGRKKMGGFGSGRGQSGKDTTSDYRALDVRRLQRDGLLTPGRSFGWNWTRNGERWPPSRCERKPTGDSQLPSTSKWRQRLATDGIPGAIWNGQLHAWRTAGLVSLPGTRMRAARGDAVYRRFRHLRLSALLQAGLCQPAGNPR